MSLTHSSQQGPHGSHSRGRASSQLTTDDFDYALPPDRIASHPPAQRGDSRLLRLAGAALSDHAFAELPAFINGGDVLVFNDTRVIRARLFGEKETGGRIEVLIERLLPDAHVLAQLRASKSPKPGTRLALEGVLTAVVVARHDDLFELVFEGGNGVPMTDGQLADAIERHGHLPLPPYIDRAADRADDARYQTVYARASGAVAAPTAGLHFDEAMLDRLRARGVVLAWLTLHVGAGTFQPVRTHRIAEHRMHAERYAIPVATVEAITAARRTGKRVIAVGTTSLRALEAAALAAPRDTAWDTARDTAWDTARDTALSANQAGADDVLRALEGETSIFITPGFRFRVADALLTNFHLPRSTLLMLVSAFAGMEPVRKAYAHAIAGGYRFFSYGDAMLVERATEDRRAKDCRQQGEAA